MVTDHSISNNKNTYTLTQLEEKFENEGIILDKTRMNRYFVLNYGQSAAYSIKDSRSELYFYIFDSEEECIKGRAQIEEENSKLNIPHAPNFNSVGNILIIYMVYPDNQSKEMSKIIEVINNIKSDFFEALESR